jgi:hypothetical protein
LIDKDSLKIKCVGACPNRIAALTMAGVTMTGSHGGGDLIAAIYDAVTDPSRWDEVVKRIVEATKSFSGNLVLQQADAGSLTALYNVDPFFADAYSQTYHKNDPLKTRRIRSTCPMEQDWKRIRALATGSTIRATSTNECALFAAQQATSDGSACPG